MFVDEPSLYKWIKSTTMEVWEKVIMTFPRDQFRETCSVARKGNERKVVERVTFLHFFGWSSTKQNPWSTSLTFPVWLVFSKNSSSKKTQDSTEILFFLLASYIYCFLAFWQISFIKWTHAETTSHFSLLHFIKIFSWTIFSLQFLDEWMESE